VSVETVDREATQGRTASDKDAAGVGRVVPSEGERRGAAGGSSASPAPRSEVVLVGHVDSDQSIATEAVRAVLARQDGEAIAVPAEPKAPEPPPPFMVAHRAAIALCAQARKAPPAVALPLLTRALKLQEEARERAPHDEQRALILTHCVSLASDLRRFADAERFVLEGLDVCRRSEALQKKLEPVFQDMALRLTGWRRRDQEESRIAHRLYRPIHENGEIPKEGTVHRKETGGYRNPRREVRKSLSKAEKKQLRRERHEQDTEAQS
jgi:hypothetical protein